MGSEAELAVLNSSQIRAVGATLRLVEETVGRIERLLVEPLAGITFRLDDDLDVGERRAIYAECEQAREAVFGASRRLGTGIVARSRRAEIRGELSVLWALLQDTKSPALRGYGSLSPGAGRVVDEMLEEISRVVVRVLGLVAAPQRGVVTES